ncbi:MAG: triose-phosphate isomerase [Burkholderiaceae bacterium]
MNGSLAANELLLTGLKQGLPADRLRAEIVVCAPTPYLSQVQTALHKTEIGWGAQDVSHHSSGAFTGEVAASMLLDFSCRFAIVGHSERRSHHAESDSVVALKARALLSSDITPIVCVGETLAEREIGQTESIVGRQLDAVLDELEPKDLVRLVVAYEPVWAIGTGLTATPQIAQDVHALLRARLTARSAAAGAAVRILYGGSMKADNAGGLLAMPDIDGGLIGGAALKAVEFLAIIDIAHQTRTLQQLV